MNRPSKPHLDTIHNVPALGKETQIPTVTNKHNNPQRHSEELDSKLLRTNSIIHIGICESLDVVIIGTTIIVQQS